MISTTYDFKNKSKVGTLIKYCLIVSVALFVLLATSCALIPGGKECNAVVDSFMEAAAAKDIDTAFALTVPGATRKGVEDFILGEHYLFEGYQDVKMRGIEVHWSEEGNTAEYVGEAQYVGGFKRGLEAWLVKSGEEWKITRIWVEMLPEEF